MGRWIRIFVKEADQPGTRPLHTARFNKPYPHSSPVMPLCSRSTHPDIRRNFDHVHSIPGTHNLPAFPLQGFLEKEKEKGRVKRLAFGHGISRRRG